jgi:hypothetical protein
VPLPGEIEKIHIPRRPRGDRRKVATAAYQAVKLDILGPLGGARSALTRGQLVASAVARPAARPEKMQPPRNVPSSAR